MERKYHRVGFTAAQSAELWERWKKGEGVKAIGRVLGKPHSCIWAHLRPSGGIRPTPGDDRRRRADQAQSSSKERWPAQHLPALCAGLRTCGNAAAVFRCDRADHRLLTLAPCE
jgi:hypothetical protein